MDNGKGAFDSMTASQVRAMIDAAMAGGASSSQFDFIPTEGSLLAIPDTDSVIINVLLWPAADLNNVTVKIPDKLVESRRVFIYMADGSVAQLALTAAEGVEVRNGVASMNKFDLLVFSTVSTSRKIIARVATS